MDINDQIARNIKIILRLKGLRPYTLSKNTNMDHSILSRFLTRSVTEIKASNLYKIASYLNVPMELLISDSDLSQYPNINEKAESSEFIKVKFYDVAVSTGVGSDRHTNDFPIDTIAIRKSKLPKFHASNTPEHLHMLRVEGDSMYPTFADNDVVIIDSNISIINLYAGIYAIKDIASETLRVKRLNFDKDGNLEVISDNKAYDKMIYTKSDLEQGKLMVIGRVFWYGRFFRG